MYATQLLRILQTVPSDVKLETSNSVNDTASQDMIMKENQNGMTHYDYKSFERDSDTLAVGSKLYQLTGLRRDVHSSPFDAKGTEECWKPKTMDELSMDNQNRTRGSTVEEFRNGCLESLGNDNDPLSSDQTRPEHDPSVSGGEFMHLDEGDSGDCRLPYVTASDLLEREENLLTDKTDLEYEDPDLIVCYKEMNYHVKDICVDEGVPASKKILTESSKDNKSPSTLPGGLKGDNHHKANQAIDEATSTETAELIIANQQGSKKEGNGIKLVTQGWPKLPSESSPYKDCTRGCNLEEFMQKGATDKTAMQASDEESFVDSALPIQEFGTRSFLRSFLTSLDDEGNKAMQLLDQQQLSSGEVVSSATSTEAGAKKDVQASILCYNSEVETRSITFNFNSLPPAAGGATNRLNPKYAEADILSARNQAQWVSSNDDDESADLCLKNCHQLTSSKNANSGGQVTTSHVEQYEDSLRRYDEGESSFCADNYVTHSGPIAFSGSISLRSDASATSFAFPVLQAEWSSSPVRMTEADRRRFRKHKGWRSGLFCCRF